MKYHTLFFRKLGKMSQNLSSAAVVVGALRVNDNFDLVPVWFWPPQSCFVVQLFSC